MSVDIPSLLWQAYNFHVHNLFQFQLNYKLPMEDHTNLYPLHHKSRIQHKTLQKFYRHDLKSLIFDI